MGSIAEIEFWPVEQLAALAQAAASRAGAAGSYLGDTSGKLAADAWTGDARDSYDGAAARLGGEVADDSDRASKLATLTQAYYTAAKTIKTNLEALDAEVSANGFSMLDDGTIQDERPSRGLFGNMLRNALKAVFERRAKLLIAQEDRANQAYADAIDSGSFDTAGLTDALSGYEFNDQDLFGPDGLPKDTDVQQDSIGDCYLDAVMMSMAKTDPDWLKNHMHFDPSTGNYTVSLWDGKKWQNIQVTQQDVDDNIADHGASKRDDGVSNAPIWPTVLEDAYAKLKSNKGDTTDKLNKIGKGGWSEDPMKAITGSKGTTIKPGITTLLNPTGKGSVYQRIDQGLQDGRAVTLSTNGDSHPGWFGKNILGEPTIGNDGLVGNHVYEVDRVYTGSDGKPMVELTNPWGNNMDGNKPVPGNTNPSSRVVTVPLETIVDSGRFQSVNISSAP